ncbi:MAG: MBL fold metallo-hydrolase [Euryarchaeota archaeon]|jgi:hydroxyacylglutathione hydrolase|nr:MBL fold metallo-hydrolase [Euryarchaeota archaeon]
MISNLAAGIQAFTSNAFLVSGERTVLVDTGANFDSTGMVREQANTLDAVILTHTHPDHVENVPQVRETFEGEIWGYDPGHPEVDHAIADGNSVKLGDHEYMALHTPGHKDDHLCFYSADAEILFAGDLIFQNGGFGRTDLPEGNREVLIESIEYVAETVSEELAELHCGHGPSIEGDAYRHIELARQAARR